MNDMNLSKFYNDDIKNGHHLLYNTDKGRNHNYIDGYYTEEFTNKHDKNIKLLEIGLAWGDSARLWKDWFINGEIYIIENDEKLLKFSPPNVNIFFGDGYSLETINYFKDIDFDYIIDDGPHTIESNLFTINRWIDRLKYGGKIIIEDVQQLHWIDIFEKSTPYLTNVFDLRETHHAQYMQNQQDDIIFEITKINK